MNVTTCAVVPSVDDTAPFTGAIKVGQDLAVQVGARELHELFEYIFESTTALQVVVFKPLRE